MVHYLSDSDLGFIVEGCNDSSEYGPVVRTLVGLVRSTRSELELEIALRRACNEDHAATCAERDRYESAFDEATARCERLRAAVRGFVHAFDRARLESSDGWRISIADLVEADMLASRILSSPEAARAALSTQEGPE